MGELATNTVVLAGRITDTPVYGTTASGVDYCTFTLAQSRMRTTQRLERSAETLLVRVIAYNGVAARGRLARGTAVVVEGKLKRQTWREGPVTPGELYVHAREIGVVDAPEEGEP